MAIDLQANDIPVMLSIKEVSARTGISYESIRYLCLTDQITFIRVGRSGGKYLINYKRFLEFLDRGVQNEQR